MSPDTGLSSIRARISILPARDVCMTGPRQAITVRQLSGGSLSATKARFALGHLPAPVCGLRTCRKARLPGELDAPSGVLRRQVTLSHEVLYIQDSWPVHPISGRVRLLVPQSWRIVTLEPQTVVFARDGIEAALTVTSGTMTAATIGHWACRYLQDMPAHTIDLSPPENDDLQWNVSRRA